MTHQPTTVELFLAATLATGLTIASSTTSYSHQVIHSSDHPILTQGGEGGEGGEGGMSHSNPDVNYMIVLGLMQGHLIAAEELLKAGNYQQAEPHIGHPVDELYDEIAQQLSERKVDDFKATLKQLHDLSKSAPQSPEMSALFQQSTESINQAIAAIPAEQRQSPDFILEVIVGMLQTAAAEYEASINNNQFAEIVEYQDARGFLIYSRELYQTIAPQMSQEKPESHQIIINTLAELETAWPSIDPPNTIIKTPSEVYSLVSVIELQK